MLGSKCDLTMHVRNLGYLILLHIGVQNHFFSMTSDLRATLTAYIFEKKHDIDNRTSALTAPSKTTWTLAQCSRKRVQELKKRKKSCFIGLSKKRKSVKNVLIIFHGCLMFIVPLHCCQNLTLPNVHTRCSAMAQNGSHSQIWELNYSDHWAKYVISFPWIGD